MDTKPTSSGSLAVNDPLDDPRVCEIVAAYQDELQAGRRPDRDEYLGRYPELAAAISECLDGLQFLHAGLSNHSGSSLSPKTDFASDPLLKASLHVLGDFQIIGEIARGGMGVVYEAVQLSLNRRVALKVLPFAATIDPRQLQRFKIEAQAAALLHHNHIVPIYAIGCERGVHFYAMQLIEGQSLAAVLQGLRATAPLPVGSHHPHAQAVADHDESLSGTRSFHGGTPPLRSHAAGVSAVDNSNASRDRELNLTLAARSTVNVAATVTGGDTLDSEAFSRRAAKLMIQAAEALEHAHQSGVVHRDIKPANLLIDQTGKLWITDFGLAQLQNENGLTRSNDMLGTFRYMSPEQMGGQRAVLDHRTDIYSLGATFYELMTLQPVFAGTTQQELLYQILHTEPRRPREWNRAIPIELETIILKALGKAPSERYATAQQFASDLQRFLDHQPILARRPTGIERARKWLRRHPAVLATGTLLLIVMAIGSSVASWLIAQEQRRTADALHGQQLRADEAEARFDQARQAVDTLFQISEEELTDRSVEGARKRILEVVLTHYEEFIEQRRSDKDSQAELAAVQDKAKTILHELTVLQHAADYRLLERPAAQTDLQMSVTQQERLQELLHQWRDAARSMEPLMRDSSEATRRATMVAMAERQDRELKALLNSTQQARFRQIVIQSRGLAAFKDHEVVRVLGLSLEQRSKIRDLEREMFFQLFRQKRWPDHRHPDQTPSDRRPGPPPDRNSKSLAGEGTRNAGDSPNFSGQGTETGFEKPASQRSQPPESTHNEDGLRFSERNPLTISMEKAVALLTPEQTLKWQALVGTPFMDDFARGR